MWTTGVQGFDTLPYLDICDLIWNYMVYIYDFYMDLVWNYMKVYIYILLIRFIYNVDMVDLLPQYIYIYIGNDWVD